jgi:GT2 family glycosyltransferase
MIGIIAIGRNEGDRLKTCLAAASTRRDAVIVYVDSASTDGSVDLARSFNAHVVALDMSKPFSAARARNEGFAKLIEVAPEVEFVQFLDGDCELQPTWIDTALDAFRDRPQAAIVCGRRRERHPDASIYNRLCDIEWNTPVGKALACGGDALVRVAAFKEVGGYNPAVIAGEEPEMCVRLRAKGWEIHRIDAEMTLHDAAMTKFGQWWKRNYRAGHAYAEGNDRHGAPPERFREKEVKSNATWGLLWFVPLAWPLHALLALKIAKYMKSNRGLSTKHALLYGFSVALGKLPQFLGQRKYYRNKLAGKQATIIEYKGATT